MRRLFNEVDLLKGQDLIISSNVETRNDGTPRSDRRAPDDTGVAIYFKLDGKDRVLACDKWDRVADNIAAIAAHIDTIRRQDRYGVGTIDQAFAGYTALPAPMEMGRHWSAVLDVPATANKEEINLAFMRMAKKYHPDNKTTGDATRMAEINTAVEQARKERS